MILSIAQNMLLQNVCLSVRLSVCDMPVFCQKGSVYHHYCRCCCSTIRYGNIPMWTPNGYEKNHDFRPATRYISETIQDMAIVTMEPNLSKVSMTVSDLE